MMTPIRQSLYASEDSPFQNQQKIGYRKISEKFVPFEDVQGEQRPQKKLKSSSQFNFLAKDNVDAIRSNISKNKIDEEYKISNNEEERQSSPETPVFPS